MQIVRYVSNKSVYMYVCMYIKIKNASLEGAERKFDLWDPR